MIVNKLLNNIQSVLPVGLTTSIKSNIEAVIRSNFEKLDLVTREQFEVQEKVLERTYKRVSAMEERVRELEEVVAGYASEDKSSA